MNKDKNMICYGLGVTDPKEVFSTTNNLKDRFGNHRVFDVPCSENALTGISIEQHLIMFDLLFHIKELTFLC